MIEIIVMDHKPLYIAIANKRALGEYLDTRKFRRILSNAASSTPVLLLTRKDRSLADWLLLDGIKEGIETHLSYIPKRFEVPTRKETLEHLADKERFSKEIYIATSQRIDNKPKKDIDETIYLNAFFEISTLSNNVALHYHNHVMENYAKKRNRR